MEKLHGAVQQDVHIDSLIGVRTEGRSFRDLKERALKRDRVVFGHRAALLETQSLLDLWHADFSPGRLCVSSELGEPTVMHGKIALQYCLGLLWGLGSGQPQLTDQWGQRGSG